MAAPACSPVMTSKITNYGWSIRLIDPRGELSVPPEEELRAAPPVLEPEIHGPVPERSPSWSLPWMSRTWTPWWPWRGRWPDPTPPAG